MDDKQLSDLFNATKAVFTIKRWVSDADLNPSLSLSPDRRPQSDQDERDFHTLFDEEE